MVHGVQLRGGRAEWYRNRYVRDLKVCEVKGWDPVPGPGGDLPFGGVANTSVIAHGGKIFAIVEAGGLPVELDDELETVRYSDFEGTLDGGFTAHPRGPGERESRTRSTGRKRVRTPTSGASWIGPWVARVRSTA